MMFGPADRRAFEAIALEIRTLGARIDAQAARIETLTAKQMLIEQRFDAHDKSFSQFRNDMDERNDDTKKFEDESRADRHQLSEQINSMTWRILGGMATLIAIASAVLHFAIH